MTQISVTRALANVKVLTKRINELSSSQFVRSISVSQKETIETSAKLHKSNFDKVQDLTKEVVNLKTKIQESNFKTKVIISGKEYTVAEAIELKRIHEEALNSVINSIRNQLRNAVTSSHISEDKVSIAQNDYIKAAGNESSNLENHLEYLRSIHLQQVVGFSGKENDIEEVNKVIDEFTDFLSEVDFVLSESNSTTMIEV